MECTTKETDPFFPISCKFLGQKKTDFVYTPVHLK